MTAARQATGNRMGTWTAPWIFLFLISCTQTPGGEGGYKIAYVPSKSGQHGIFAMNSDTTGSKLLAADPMAQLRFASWSPAGDKIAFFSVRAQDADILKEYRMPYQYLLYVMDANGNNQKRLLDFPVIDFAWAPDSERMLIISAHEGTDRDSPEVLNGTKNPLASVYVFDLKSGALTRMGESGRNCTASWSPDGTRLAISFGEADNGGIYIMTADGKQGGRLTNAPSIDCRPKWSPDGQSLVYVAYPTSEGGAADRGVFVIHEDGSGKKQVDEEDVYYARWSDDGRRLLLQTTNQVKLINPDGTSPVLISAGLRRTANGIFTPDGKGVMFCSDDEGAWNIYSIGLDGQDRKKLTGRTNSSNYCLSPLLTGK